MCEKEQDKNEMKKKETKGMVLYAALLSGSDESKL